MREAGGVVVDVLDVEELAARNAIFGVLSSTPVAIADVRSAVEDSGRRLGSQTNRVCSVHEEGRGACERPSGESEHDGYEQDQPPAEIHGLCLEEGIEGMTT